MNKSMVSSGVHRMVLAAIMLLVTNAASAEGINQVKLVVAEAHKDGVTPKEYETLKPRLLAQVNIAEKLGPSLKALTMMYELGRCIPGEAGAAVETDVVSRFIDAKLDIDKLSDADWKETAEFIRSIKAMGEGERELVAFHRPLSHLDRIRASSKSPRLGAVALFAKAQAALILDRIVKESPLEPKVRTTLLEEMKNAPKEFGSVVADGKSTFDAIIPLLRFELENLYEGRPAPEIEGVDLDGKPMKLSDYRGKTVLLVAWADWCPDCIKAIPGEKEVMKKFAGQPVAFVGINGDDKREVGQKSSAKHELPGRSFWGRWPGADNKQTTTVDQWSIRFWPSYYVIDPKGVIQFKRCWDTEPAKLVEIINKAMSGSSSG